MRALVFRSVFFLATIMNGVFSPAMESILNIEFGTPEEHDGALFIEDCQTVARDAGLPLLPSKIVKIVLAPDTDPSTISTTVRMSGLTDLLPVDIAPAPHQQPLGLPGQNSGAVKKAAVYSRDAFFPEQFYRVLGTEISHGYPVLLLEIFPVRWNPVSKEAVAAARAKVVVRSDGGRGKKMPETYRGLTRDRLDVARLVENPGALGRIPVSKSYRATDREYLIITSSSMLSAFQTLADHRGAVDGFSTHVEDIGTILSTFTGRDDAEKLKNYIKDSYLNHGTSFRFDFVSAGERFPTSMRISRPIFIMPPWMGTGMPMGTVTGERPGMTSISCPRLQWVGSAQGTRPRQAGR